MRKKCLQCQQIVRKHKGRRKLYDIPKDWQTSNAFIYKFEHDGCDDFFIAVFNQHDKPENKQKQHVEKGFWNMARETNNPPDVNKSVGSEYSELISSKTEAVYEIVLKRAKKSSGSAGATENRKRVAKLQRKGSKG